MKTLICTILLAAVSAFAAPGPQPPILRNSLTTNTEPAALNVITQILNSYVSPTGGISAATATNIVAGEAVLKNQGSGTSNTFERPTLSNSVVRGPMVFQSLTNPPVLGAFIPMISQSGPTNLGTTLRWESGYQLATNQVGAVTNTIWRAGINIPGSPNYVAGYVSHYFTWETYWNGQMEFYEEITDSNAVPVLRPRGTTKVHGDAVTNVTVSYKGEASFDGRYDNQIFYLQSIYGTDGGSANVLGDVIIKPRPGGTIGALALYTGGRAAWLGPGDVGEIDAQMINSNYLRFLGYSTAEGGTVGFSNVFVQPYALIVGSEATSRVAQVNFSKPNNTFPMYTYYPSGSAWGTNGPWTFSSYTNGNSTDPRPNEIWQWGYNVSARSGWNSNDWSIWDSLETYYEASPTAKQFEWYKTIQWPYNNTYQWSPVRVMSLEGRTNTQYLALKFQPTTLSLSGPSGTNDDYVRFTSADGNGGGGMDMRGYMALNTNYAGSGYFDLQGGSVLWLRNPAHTTTWQLGGDPTQLTLQVAAGTARPFVIGSGVSYFQVFSNIHDATLRGVNSRTIIEAADGVNIAEFGFSDYSVHFPQVGNDSLLYLNGDVLSPVTIGAGIAFALGQLSLGPGVSNYALTNPVVYLDSGIVIDQLQLKGLEDYAIGEGTIEARLDNLEAGGVGGGSTNSLTNASPASATSGTVPMMTDRVTVTNSQVTITGSGGTNLNAGKVTTIDATISGILSANVMVVDSLVSTTRLYSATVFKAMDGTNANTYMQTNRATGNFGLQWTNTTPGQTMLCNVMGEVVGGTDRTITNIVPTGYLVRSNGGALSVGPLLVGLPDGTNIEFSVLHKFENGTNVEDIVVSIQVQ